jgi:hypothetical protein
LKEVGICAAPPNGRPACTYDDEITFTKGATGTIIMSVDNKGQSFIFGGAGAAFFA